MSPEINVELSEYTKDAHPALYLQEFQRIVNEKFKIHIFIYTDCSKCAAGVGSADLCNGNSKRETLPKIASVFSAELHAIQLALRIIMERGDGDYVIVTDSLSSLQNIGDKQTKHPISRKIQHLYQQHKREIYVDTVTWVLTETNKLCNRKISCATPAAIHSNKLQTGIRR